MPRFSRLVLVLLLVLTPLLGLTATTAAQGATAVDIDDDQLLAVRPESRDDLAAVIEAGLTAYTIDVTISETEGGGIIAGSIDIDYLNDTGDEIDELPLRMYANGNDDPVTITAAEVDGETVEPELSVYNSVATLDLPDPLAADERVEIALEFETVVPFGSQIHYGMLGIDPENDTWAVAHWYPMVAAWEAGEGWALDPPSFNGDPVFSTTATYEVTITAPDDLVLVTSGVETDAEQDGEAAEQTVTYVTGPARDFVWVADDEFQLTSTEVDGTTVNSWYLPDEAQNGEMVATYAARSLEYFNDAIGPYPFADLDLISIEVYGALGIEFPQLIYMARDYYTRDIDLDAPNNLEFTVAHEVMHQWWYALVGNNQYEHAFIDEGLTNYVSGDLYFRHVYGDEVGGEFSETAFRNAYENGMNSRGDRLVDMPTDDYPSSEDYVFAMYFKAAVGFSEIQEEIGEEAFLEGLALYFERFRFGVAGPDDLLEAFEDASGEDLGEIWTLWFETDTDD